MPTAVPPPDSLAERLRAHLAAVLGRADLRIADLEQLTAGASRQSWRFTLRRGPTGPDRPANAAGTADAPGTPTAPDAARTAEPGTPDAAGPGDPAAALGTLTASGAARTGMADAAAGTADKACAAAVPMVLRLDPPGESRPETLAAESAAMAAAARAGVPTPRVVSWGNATDDFGAPFMIMDFIAGETIPQRILRRPELAAARATLAEQCGRLLARIHRIPVESVPQLPRAEPMAELREVYDRLQLARPAMEMAFRWLAEHSPGPFTPAVVHGDFRNGNLIVGEEGVRAVLDWEQTHIGDPRQDLGWLCVRSWRFGGPRPVGGFGDYRQLIDAYSDEGGGTLDHGALRWWIVFETLRWGIMCVHQADRHLSGATRSVNLVAIGRRACEQEYDLLNLMDAAEAA